MAATDAGPVPVKNQAYRITFPILDADGDPVSAAAGLDSEVSKDGAAFADCTAEAGEIGTSGIYYLDLTAAEMNADTIAVRIQTTTPGAKTTPIVMYPNKSGSINVNVTAWAGSATTTADIALKTALAKGTQITGFNDLSAAQVNAEADTALVDVGLTSTVTGRIDAAVSTRSTQTSVDTLTTYVDTEVGAIKTKTDQLNFTGTDVKATLDGEAVTASSVTDKTGYSLTGIYDPAKSAASQASVNTIDDFLDTEMAAVKTATDKLDTAMELDGAVYRFTANALEQAPVSGGGGGTDWTSGEREQIRSRLGMDGTQSAPSASNPIASQSTSLAIKAKTDALPADPADASDIAGEFTTVNTKLDGISGAVDTEIGAIKAQTDQLSFTDGRVDANATITLTADDFNDLADAVLKRDWTALSGEAVYSLLNAARMLRNEWSTTGGTLTVMKEDGASVAWTRTLSTDPNAQPIVGAT